jgi:protein arginine N-methyltransferase 3
VAESRCWICGVTCESGRDLQNHIHETVNIEDVKPLWADDRYLKPFMEDDSLLYSFGEDEEDEDGDDYSASIDKDELMRDLKSFEEIYISDENTGETILYNADNCGKNGRKGAASASNGCLNIESSPEKAIGNGMESRECVSLSGRKLKDTHLRGSFPTIIAKDIKNVNEHYFGAYSSFGIHREMISDKVRTLSLGFPGEVKIYSCQKLELKKKCKLFVNAISYILVIAGENRCL